MHNQSCAHPSPSMYSTALCLALSAGAVALDNGFGRTPVMGYNSYNDVGCSPNSTQITATINAMAAKGLPGLGYEYFQDDCGWQGYERQKNGSITYDASVFPNGIRPLSSLAKACAGACIPTKAQDRSPEAGLAGIRETGCGHVCGVEYRVYEGRQLLH